MRDELERRLAALGGRGHRALVAGVIEAGERVACPCPAGAERPDEHSLFEIGSITKTFAGVLLADTALRGSCRSTTRSPATCRARARPGAGASRRCSSSRRTGAGCRTHRRA